MFKPGRREQGQAPSQDTGLVALVRRVAQATCHFSDKEKDEASPTASAARDSSNAFIPVFAEWRFFYASVFALVSYRIRRMAGTMTSAMKQISIVLLAVASFTINTHAASSNYAARVVSYNPGTGHSTAHTNASAALGEPSRVNPYSDAVEPFNPPYGTEQIVSIGAGGSLTLELERPIFHSPRRPYGIDFIIFGNSGFVITNDYDLETYNWIGTPATDGSMFAHNTGTTKVSVSANGSRFFELTGPDVPTVDLLYPTDGSGNFNVPVNPALGPEDFIGATLEQIRGLYAGSAGGAGYDFSTARDASGRRVPLPFVRYVRIEVIAGKAEVDGVSAVIRKVRKSRAE